MKPPAPGIHKNVPFAEYTAWDAINASSLKPFAVSAKKARHEMTHGSDETDDTLIGHASHAAILQPDVFAAEYVVGPQVDKRTTAGKAKWGAFELANADKCILKPAEHDEALAIRDMVQADPHARELLGGKGLREASIVWIDDETGLTCKARLDLISTYQGEPAICDFKTTLVEPTNHLLASEASKWDWHVQAAYYIDGANVIAPLQRRFYWLIASKADPMDVVIRECDEQTLVQGRREYRDYLRQYARCRETNHWPGAGADGPRPLYLPVYRYDKG